MVLALTIRSPGPERGPRTPPPGRRTIVNSEVTSKLVVFQDERYIISDNISINVSLNSSNCYKQLVTMFIIAYNII